MDFSLSEDQLLIRDTVRQFMEAEVRPSIRRRDKEEEFGADELRRLGEMGCCGMLVPEEWGGAGVDTLSYVLMLEEVARIDAALAVALSVTNSVVAWPLYRHGTDAQRRRYLAQLARGEILGAFGLTEPRAGSDSAAIETRAERRGDVYLLNGTKSWVTNGGQSGLYIVFAKTDPAAGARGVTAFLVEPRFSGFRVSRYEDKMGLRTSRTAEISFTDCEVPAENRLGAEGQGLKIALEALDGGRVGIAAQGLGIAEGALEAAVKFASDRRAFGKAISEFQAIEWMLADMHTEIEAARVLIWQAAWLRDEELRDEELRDGELRANASRANALRDSGPSPHGRLGAHASRAKLYAGEMVNRVVYKAVQIHGSMGYSRESDVERMYRDARVISIYEGTSEIQRLIVARDLLAHPAAGVDLKTAATGQPALTATNNGGDSAPSSPVSGGGGR
jgi:alkylation response protein AidB-like acyl-CoA dehydrogenase